MESIKHIVERPPYEVIQEHEAVLVVREYIRVRKGYDIVPVVTSFRGYSLLAQACNDAIAWFIHSKQYT